MSTLSFQNLSLMAQTAPKLPKVDEAKGLAAKADKLKNEALNIDGELAITILKVLAVIVSLVLLAALLYFVVAFVLKKVRAHRAKAAMQRELNQSADAESDSKRSELIAAFDASVEKISQSPKGESALDLLPWYLMVGPEGVGKRSLLRHSGLEFPILQGNARGIPDLQKGPTEHCDLWVSDQGVFLDLAHRYLDTNSDAEELSALLDKIAKQRVDTPINGIVLSIDQPRLCEDDGRQKSRQSQLHKLGRHLRASIDQLSDQLGHQIPVYLIVTQCDRLPGFREFVGTLDEARHHQALGVTLPMNPSTSEHQKQLSRSLDELSDRLYEHATRTIANRGCEQAPEALFGFPQHFSDLRDGLGHFTTALLHNNGRSEALILRGVYFASAQQEQDALEHLLRSRGRSSARTNLVQEPSGPTQSGLFTKGVFSDVIFPDRAFSQETGRRKEQQTRHNLMWSIGIGTAGLALLILPWDAATDYQDLEQSAVEHVRTLGSNEHPLAGYRTKTASDTYRSMAKLEAQLNSPDGVKSAGLTWGMSNHSEIQPAYSDVTRRVVTHWAKAWMEDLVEQDRNFLEEIIARYGEALRDLRGPDLRATYTALGRYLQLTNADGQQTRSADQRAWLLTHLESEQAELDKLHQQNSRRALPPSGLAARLSETIINDDLLRLPGNRDLIRRVRRLLKDVETDHTSQYIEQLAANTSTETRNQRIDITSITDQASREFIQIDKNNAVPHIPGAFTQEAWVSMIRPRLEEEVSNPKYLRTRKLKTPPPIWIRGLRSKKAWHDARRESLRNAYVRLYESTWRAFINTIKIVERNEEGYAYNLLEKLSDAGTSPYYRLFEAVAANSFLPFAPEPTMEDAEAAAPRTHGLPLVTLQRLARFGATLPGNPAAKILPLDTYVAALGQVRDAVSEQAGGTSEQNKSFRATLKQTKRKIDRLINLHPAWNDVLKKLLITPVALAEKDAFRTRSSAFKEQWCTNIVSTFRNEFKSKYPFASTDRRGEVDLDQLTNFLHPQTGTLWQQVGALSDFVEKKGNRFTEITRPNQRKQVNEGFLNFLNQSWELAQALFPPGSAGPNVVMQVQALPRSGIQRTEFLFGQEALDHRNGPSIPVRFEWPALGDSTDLMLRVWYSPFHRSPAGKGKSQMAPLPKHSVHEPHRVRASGPWALFKFIESGDKFEILSETAFTVSWRPTLKKDPPVTLRFKLPQGISLFFADRQNPRSMLGRFRSVAFAVPTSVFNSKSNGAFQCPIL